MSRSSRAVWAVGLLLASLLLTAAPSAQAQVGIGVQIDCDGNPELNVRPSENQDVVILCTVSNSGQLESTISVDYEWQDDDPRVDMSLSEDEFTLAAGAEEEFQATFSGSPRIEADLSLDFDITAMITSVMVLPVEQLNQSATYSGELTIATFGMVDLTLTDRSTRNLEVSEEVSIGFTMGNDGNAEDKIEVNIANLAELESAGFSFPEGSFVAETVMVEGTSAERTIVLRTPSEVTEEVRMQVVFEATSTNDGTADPMQSTVTVVVQASTTNAALVGGGLEELSQDQIQLYAAIGGGVIVFFLLIFVVGRLVRRSGGPELEDVTELDEPPMPVAAAPVAPFAPFDEFDGMFDDLDGPDEFDFDGL
tara:strand:+ start:1800 stop:2897 length:1098 start_codon:yes stop_codon:yes gene_type:complete